MQLGTVVSIEEMVVNLSPNFSTLYTPFYINCVFHPRISVDLLSGDESSTVEAGQHFVQGISTLWQLIRGEPGEFMMSQARLYDKGR